MFVAPALPQRATSGPDRLGPRSKDFVGFSGRARSKDSVGASGAAAQRNRHGRSASKDSVGHGRAQSKDSAGASTLGSALQRGKHERTISKDSHARGVGGKDAPSHSHRPGGHRGTSVDSASTVDDTPQRLKRSSSKESTGSRSSHSKPKVQFDHTIEYNGVPTSMAASHTPAARSGVPCKGNLGLGEDFDREEKFVSQLTDITDYTVQTEDTVQSALSQALSVDYAFMESERDHAALANRALWDDMDDIDAGCVIPEEGLVLRLQVSSFGHAYAH